jgi:hypothetical protein
MVCRTYSTITLFPLMICFRSGCLDYICKKSFYIIYMLANLIDLNKVYDYLLTLPMEIKHIWGWPSCKPTRKKRIMTSLWLFTRYTPVVDAVIMPLIGRCFYLERDRSKIMASLGDLSRSLPISFCKTEYYFDSCWS